jgi:hypothetical protein
MRAFWEWIKGAGRFIWKNADAFFVIAIALGVVVAEVVGHPSQEIVDSAILGLLGVTAIVLLRDRVGRDDLEDLRLLAGDAISDRPYEIVRQHNHWDLTSKERTTTRVTEQLRFTRNDVSTIADWSTGDGKVVRYDAKWKRPGSGTWIDAKKIHNLPIRHGEKVVYSLEEEHCRGDMVDWFVEREAVGRFPTQHESVELSARTKSNHPRIMQITWPEGVNPTNIELRFQGEPARPLYPRSKDGRSFVEETINELPVGGSVQIAWTW